MQELLSTRPDSVLGGYGIPEENIHRKFRHQRGRWPLQEPRLVFQHTNGCELRAAQLNYFCYRTYCAIHANWRNCGSDKQRDSRGRKSKYKRLRA